MPTNPNTRHTFARHVAPFAPLALALLMQSTSQQGATPSTAPTAETQEAGFSQACSNPHFPPNSAPTSIDETNCTLAGSGGAETWQNEAKNNFCAIGPPKPITISELVNLQAKVQQEGSIPFGNPRNHPLTPKSGPATDRRPLQALGEGTEVVLSGFVLIARQEGGESVNCGKNVPDVPDNHDIHISIVEVPGQEECLGVVVEMIPHHRPKSWTPQNVNAVAARKLPVRVTGQLMFDSSHSPCQGGTSISGDPKRSSLWEVHPVYEFDVCSVGDCSSGTGWVSLEKFANP
jgi:hypothetical protein